MSQLLTFPNADALALSIRAKALVFEDPSSVALLAQVEQVAPTDATVLVIGETGTGKELLARRVHQGSRRRGPFVAVNCGAFSESLIDAELFGHEAGAFTGATQARQGWFEAANGGTLFLDEIGDLPAPLQVKLLRVLQERQIVRLGSRRPVDLDVRLIAATNIDLQDAVRAGRFRADLYYRLSVATLHLTPLCQRPGDILPLARHFLHTHAVRMQRGPAGLTLQAEAALLAYDWPGNIRELENAMHYALILAPGGTVDVGDLQVIHRHAGFRCEAPAAVAAMAAAPADTPAVLLARAVDGWASEGGGNLLHRFERALVLQAYRQCQGNQVHAARLLGVSRNVVRTLLKRHGLLDASPVALLP